MTVTDFVSHALTSEGNPLDLAKIATGVSDCPGLQQAANRLIIDCGNFLHEMKNHIMVAQEISRK